MEVNDLSVEDAIDFVKKRRPQINMGKIQRNICFDYFNKIHGIEPQPGNATRCDRLSDSNSVEEHVYPDEFCLLDDEIVQDINDEFYLI
jgi:hypothetical protein